MCQSKLIALENGGSRLIMTDVTLLDVKDDKIIIWNLLGERHVLKGYAIESVDFVSNKVYLRPLEGKE
ncbi:CooT family nickel-binding protein [Thermococcus sp.]|uniref:CooT family nickel-binding protein n=1 Tax=Thermococcus sp. TaxID=35749 RepID=UPI00199160A3|nr:CooT family nickel-binding protein [Thermococcus sp.]MBC7095396.1 CooT family nickel-binding protein [Thermococcus sp.]